MDELIKALEEKNKVYAEALAELKRAELTKSVTRHSLRENIKKQHLAAGDKISDTRTDDMAVSSDQYQKACTAEVEAIQAERMAAAEAKTALCEYEVALAQLK